MFVKYIFFQEQVTTQNFQIYKKIFFLVWCLFCKFYESLSIFLILSVFCIFLFFGKRRKLSCYISKDTAEKVIERRSKYFMSSYWKIFSWIQSIKVKALYRKEVIFKDNLIAKDFQFNAISDWSTSRCPIYSLKTFIHPYLLPETWILIYFNWFRF